jgi:cephalosporin-C deacetylase-like acetyl esterase
MLLQTLLLTATLGAEPLPSTKPLDDKDDLAAKMVAGIDAYLTRELAAAPEKRKQFWKPDYTTPTAYVKSVEPNRQRLKKLLGMVDDRKKFDDIEYVGGPKTPSLVAETEQYKIFAIRWPVFDGVDGEGLLLEPKGKVLAQVVAIPDADWTPEMLVGLAPGVQRESQFPRWLAKNGCRVVVPALIDRKDDFSGSAKFNRWTNQPHREFVYRMAYEMGRHILGYEVQKVLAVVDWFAKEKEHPPIGVWGKGEGSAIAVLSAACDTRIQSTVQGQAGSLNVEPLYRNIWAFEAEIGPEGVYELIAPRHLLVDGWAHPPLVHPAAKNGRGGAAPAGGVNGLDLSFTIARDFPERWGNLVKPFNGHFEHHLEWILVPPSADYEPPEEGHEKKIVEAFEKTLGVPKPSVREYIAPKDLRNGFDPTIRQKRQFDQLVALTQKIWRDSESVRAQRFAKVDYSSAEKYERSIEPIRKFFWEEVIGKLPAPDRPMNPRTREIYDTPKWKGYEVTLDLYPDVFAYGILLLPKDLKAGEKRPVVVCQHGLEGRPQDVCNPKERSKYYNSFGAQLADLGYIVYAPQNPYIGQDKFRVLQRKANPLKLSLFSFIVRQHERTLEWLSSLPNVDDKRIAFYGLSYGGKTAMRVPAILPKYCLSICSGDFNEWVGKNVSVDYRGSYMFSGEYEMPEFDLGETFNYAEMAYLIAPRPFMVERGHDDGVGIDEMIAYEFAKVRYLYDTKLKLPDRTEIEWFNGGHEIHSQGTFAFLKKHLK